LSALWTAFFASLQSRAALQLEILALHHQLGVIERSVKAPAPRKPEPSAFPPSMFWPAAPQGMAGLPALPEHRGEIRKIRAGELVLADAGYRHPSGIAAVVRRCRRMRAPPSSGVAVDG